ncbi:MAG TPA: UDP-N-acetylmuramoyl-L-alanyl-D-glutamate--2,6-diaminopimelate ligase [Solirubrobacteraceae bacterium]
MEIRGLAYDSRNVRSGDLFLCVSGEHSDGHDFAAQAVRSGAVALVVERRLGLGVPEVVLPSVRAAMGPLVARFYGDPSTRLRVVGVTGTNGKTTTAYLVRALIEATGEHCGLLGTVTSVVAGVERPVTHTTPEAIEVQGALRAMLDGGDAACAMEVSSHALELGRVRGTNFAAAIFTNLTQDHLDFHADMEEYFQAKRRLFVPDATSEDTQLAIAVVNVDDPYGRRLAAELPAAITFAVDGEAHYCARDVRMDFSGCRFIATTPSGERSVTLPLPGRFNVSNALGALAATHALGADLDTLVAALERGVRVPGRFEPVREGQDFSVLVDYAHTPDSLENVLRAARELARGRVVCVFGAGGDRDRGKRPLMGEIAARLADVAVVTSDNPRSEAPEAIVAQIVAGIEAAEVQTATGIEAAKVQTAGERVQVEVDRRVAIGRAIALARPDDVVVIAGKGHEQGQEFAAGRKLPFDDVTVAREALRARQAQAAGAAA